MRGGGEDFFFLGGGVSFVACLSHLTIDHASLPGRSTVRTLSRDTVNLWALIALFPYSANKRFANLILSSSSLAACGHHLPPT